jgi:hypothetical protein
VTLTLTSISECSAVEYNKSVSEQSVRGLLQFGRCELLLSEAISRHTGIVGEFRERGTSAVESRYQATTGGNITECEDLVCAVVNCRVCELAIVL